METEMRVLSEEEIESVSGGSSDFQCEAPWEWKLGRAWNRGVDAYFRRWERVF